MNQPYIFYDGRFLRGDKALAGAGSRALRYGDGLFETLKWTAGRILLGDLHFDRLFQGLNLLGFEPPAFFTPAYLAARVGELVKKNGHSTARIRLMVLRGNGGLFDPENHYPHCLIQSWPLAPPSWTLNENGLVAGIYGEARKAADGFSHLKTNNFQPYILGALHARRQQWNDAFILNGQGRICDSCHCNIFILKQGSILTPPLSEGGIGGTLRHWLLERLAGKWEFRQEPLEPADLLTADEIFLTNSVAGIRWVGQCGDSRFGNRLTARLFRDFTEAFARDFP